MENKRIAIIGCGNLGISIVNGLLEGQLLPSSNIIATRRKLKNLEHIQEKGVRLSSSNVEAVKSSEIILITLKPYNVLKVVSEISEHLISGKHILVSLATGISIANISDIVQVPVPIFRAMPNIAADVSMSMTCICSNTQDQSATKLVMQCFNSIGESIIINEGLMDAATVLGACGIAYVLRFIRGMIQGGIQIGFDAKTANRIVTQTVKGAAELLHQRKNHPEFEIDKVTTPKGCTIAGLNEMEHNGFCSALIKGIVTSFEIIE